MNHPTYNYEAQQWVDDPELASTQLAEEIMLLSGPEGPAYAAFIGVNHALALSALWARTDDAIFRDLATRLEQEERTQ